VVKCWNFIKSANILIVTDVCFFPVNWLNSKVIRNTFSYRKINKIEISWFSKIYGPVSVITMFLVLYASQWNAYLASWTWVDRRYMVNISFILDRHVQDKDSKLEASKLETETHCLIWWHNMALKKSKQRGIHSIFFTHYYHSILKREDIHGMWHIHGHVIAKEGHKIDFPLGTAMKWQVVKCSQNCKKQI